MKNLENIKAAALKLVAASEELNKASAKWESLRGNGTPEGRAFKNHTLEQLGDDYTLADEELDRAWHASESREMYPFLIVGDKVVTKDEDGEWTVWQGIVVGV